MCMGSQAGNQEKKAKFKLKDKIILTDEGHHLEIYLKSKNMF